MAANFLLYRQYWLVIQTVNFKISLCVMLKPIISLTQEAEQADKALIVENGTHTEETNAEGNLDESIVMLFLLSSLLHAKFLFTVSCFPFQFNLTISLLSKPGDLNRLLIFLLATLPQSL